MRKILLYALMLASPTPLFADALSESSIMTTNELNMPPMPLNPAPGPSPDRAKLIASIKEPNYEKLLSKYLSAFVEYPVSILGDKPQGTVLVRIRLDKTGFSRYFIVEKTSGSKLLDNAALDAIHRAIPFPPPPNMQGKDLVEFLLPIHFSLDTPTAPGSKAQ